MDRRRCPRAALLVAALALAALPPGAAALGAALGRGAGRREEALAREADSANPIRKVVTLLENLAKKVEKEAAEEDKLYEKYSCYCQSGTGDLAKAISDSSAKVPALQSDIETSESTLLQLKQDLKQHQVDRSSARSALDEATALREKEHAAYLKEAGELKGYVDSLTKAIPAIESGMSGASGAGLLQLGNGVAAALRRAVGADSELTDDDRQSVLSFLSSGTEGSSRQSVLSFLSSGTKGSSRYVPKGGEILGILKDMMDGFGKSLAAMEQEETEAVKLFQNLSAAKTKEVDALSASIERKTARVGDLQVDIVHMKNDLTETEAALVEDQQFRADLEKDCDGKKQEYEERVKTRGDELVAIHETIHMLSGDDALELFKKTLPSASFMQVQAGVEQAKRRALNFLQQAGRISIEHSNVDVRFLELVLSGRKVDFSKVIKMIDGMLNLLSQEQADDENKKEYCSTQINQAEDRVKDLTRDVADLETSIEDRTAAIAQLADEIKALQEGIAALDKSVLEATDQRKKENEEFQELISSNTAAKELLGFAKARLQKFYNPKLVDPKYAEGPTTPPPTLFVQVASSHRRASGQDAPSAPPSTWGAYQKKGEESTGIVHMIDMLIRDLDKEMIEAEKQEEMSQRSYEELMNDSAEKRAKDLKSIQVKSTSKADDEDVTTNERGDLASKKQEFMATEQVKAQLHSECDWLMQNFNLRKNARAEESESLTSAKAVLSGADFAFLEAGSTRRVLRR